MSFLHLSVAALGSSLVIIPIALHLLMRRRPKHFVFPALRFVQQRKTVNQRKLRLRHLALLMLRCLAIVALALALARPFIAAHDLANTVLVGLLAVAGLGALTLSILSRSTSSSAGLAASLAGVGLLFCGAAAFLGWKFSSGSDALLPGDSSTPVSAALVFDVSPRTGYRHRNESCLERAQKLALTLLRELPVESEIAVVDTHTGRSAFAVDRLAAKSAIEALQPMFRSSPLPEVLPAAIDMLRGSEQELKELYVFTDLTQRAWDSSAPEQISQRLQKNDVTVYVIDISAAHYSNIALGDVDLSSEYLTDAQSLRLEITASAVGTSGEQELELFLEKQDPSRPIVVDGKPLTPERTLRSRQRVTIEENGVASHVFNLRGLGPGVHHGTIRLAGTDALNADNERYFSIDVIDPWPVLISAPKAALPDLVSALSPLSFECKFVPIERLRGTNLSQFAAVGLLDPPKLPPEIWRGLADFVAKGGGLGLFLGREARPVADFNQGEAQRVLPGLLSRQWRASRQPFLIRLGEKRHPIISALREKSQSIPWSDFPVYRHWALDSLKKDATVVIQFSNGQPFLIESVIGQGRVLTATTPISDPLNVRGRPPWNEVPTGPDPWPYFVMVNDGFRYLVQAGDTRLNYAVGETATIETQSLGANQRLQVYQPITHWQDVVATGNLLTYRFTESPGTFRVRNVNLTTKQRGFSVNLPFSETNLSQIDTQLFDGFFGDANYLISEDPIQIERRVGGTQRGRDYYPWLLAMAACLLAVEHLLGNRFYATVPALMRTKNTTMAQSPS